MSVATDPLKPAFRLQVLERGRVVYAERFDGPVDVGRQEMDEPQPVALCQRDGRARLIIASHQEATVARLQLRIVPRPDGALELTNLSQSVFIRVEGGEMLPAGASRTVEVAATLCFGPKRVSVFNLQPAAGLNSLPDATIAPGMLRRENVVPATVRSSMQTARDSADVVRALQATMDVFQQASSKEEFFASAAKGAREVVALHSASVVECRDGAWTEVARSGNPLERLRAASTNVLASVFEHKRTFWDAGLSGASATASLAGVEAVIAAPILNRHGAVVGALYGDRSSGMGDLRPIGQLDALLLELLACGVASGLARLEQEDLARRMQLRFEQFNSKEITQALETTPTLLDGREVDATMLFCDVRSFSRICAKIGSAAAIFPWINDVLDTLSECVTRHGGVLVDYIGDELMAMWGAPQPQPDHAERACRAAAEMLGELPGLNERWEEKIGEPVGIGIGINSGRVRAGNTGSKRRFKYGPLGSAVNVASRVQGATKFLKAPLLITGNTAQLLGPAFCVRRLGDVRMVNIAEPVRLYELMQHPEASAAQIRTTYELALSEFEQQNYRQAAAALAPLLNTFADDGPSLLLLSRVVNAMVHGPDPDHPVWVLPGK